ncbi:MAG: AtpZ/AtpI family protein [Alphaproteobacteria bacterium]|nr:MAG: AtpZ/AtpI family protein [Alphaproteobacteria bacterium]
MTDRKSSRKFGDFSSRDSFSDEHEDLKRLGKRLREARKGEAAEEEHRQRADSLPNNGLGVALRIGIELVVAVFVGAGIGFFLDRWLGTQPWLLLVFFMLGTAAGFMNVIRMAQSETLSPGNKLDGPAVDDEDD